MSENKLTRSETDKMIAGVCGGLAEYLNLDPVWVRLLLCCCFCQRYWCPDLPGFVGHHAP